MGEGMEEEILAVLPFQDIFVPKATAQENKDTDLQFLTLQKALTKLALAQEEQERALAATKTEKKFIERKAEITKKDKDITIVIEDEDSQEKLKDPFKDGILAITIDMLGFEKFHLEQYQQQLANYARFLAEYLEAERFGLRGQTASYTYSDQKQEVKQETTEVQMVSFTEKQDYSRANALNGLLGYPKGASGANYVDPDTTDSWELWRIFQFNQIMSFYYTSEWRH